VKRSMASEWLKLRRRGMLAALAATIGVAVLGTVIAIATAGQTGARGGAGSGTGITVATLRTASGLGQAIGSASTLLGVVALSVFAASFAGEYSNGTLRNLLVNEPRRVRLLAGKLSALWIATTAALALASAVCVAAAAITASRKGIDTSLWWTSSGFSHTAVAVANLAAATLGWGLLGAVLGIAFRSPAAAVGIGVAYALPLESILGAIANGAGRWLPGKLLAALASGGNSTASYAASAVTLALYATLAAVGTMMLFARRDVT
jgi:ABC-2 type transport system permease protein